MATITADEQIASVSLKDAERDPDVRRQPGGIRRIPGSAVGAFGSPADGGDGLSALGSAAHDRDGVSAVGARAHDADTDHPAHGLPQLRHTAVIQRRRWFAGRIRSGQLLDPQLGPDPDLRSGPTVTWVGAGLTARPRA